jgi:hypothetical protein
MASQEEVSSMELVLLLINHPTIQCYSYIVRATYSIIK